MMRRLLVGATAAAVALVSAAVLQSPLSALAAAPPAGSSGHDISWPQCNASYPTDGSFGIVGVTDGRAWSANPCLGSEYGWAAAQPRTPDVYMNTANPAPHSGYYWPASGARDPALCRDASLTTDPGCAYDYGWHTAADAMATATAALGSNQVGYWWLDVETGNTWNGDASSNAADLQGSIDYLMAQHVAGVGVYSTDYQWTTITGGYSASNAAQYASAWSGEFTSPNGIANSPSWVAGASGPSDAPSYCSSSFLGTTTWMMQYISGGFDVDYACATGSPPPPPPAAYTVAVPSSTAASTGSTVSTTITLTSTGNWSGTVSLSVRAPSRVSATLSASSVALAANTTATSTLRLRSSRTGTYTVTVVATPKSGSSTTTTHSATTSFSVGTAPRLRSGSVQNS
jgi:hypothetical protein